MFNSTKHRILVLVRNQQTRSKINEWLRSTYQVQSFDQIREASEIELDFDISIVDNFNIESYETFIQKSEKQGHISILPPVLLIASNRDIFMTIRRAGHAIDDFILAPLESMEFHMRINLMLRAGLMAKESSLQRRQLYFIRKAFENASDAILLLNARNEVIYQNNAFIEMYGYEQEELNEQGFANLVFSEPEFAEEILSAVREGKQWRGECHTITYENREVPNILQADRITDDNGYDMGTALFFTDLTMLIRMRSELEESEQLLRQLTENLEQVLWLRDTRGERILYISPAYEEIWGQKIERLYNDANAFTQNFHPDDKESFIHTWRENYDGVLDTEIRLIHPRKGVRWVRIQRFPIFDQNGNLYRSAGIAEDITNNKAIMQSEKRQRAMTEALRDNVTVLTSTLELDQVLDTIMESLKNVVKYDVAQVFLIHDDSVAQVIRAKNFDRFGDVKKLYQRKFHVHRTPHIRDIHRTHQPQLIPDLELDWENENSFAGSWAKSFVGIPIFDERTIIGFITLLSKRSDAFTPVHADNLMAFAEQVTIAIRNSQAYEKALALAALEERQRLARNLHDAVSQTLFSASMIAEALPTIWERNTEKGLSRLEQLLQLTRGAQAEMRTLLLELRPDALYDAPIDQLLYQLTEAVKGKGEIEISLDVAEGFILPSEAHIAFYYIAQEALNNVLKHSYATKVDVRFYREDDTLILLIRDNGDGFESKKSSTSMGLNIMKERAEAVNAKLTIESKIGEGTTVYLMWKEEANYEWATQTT